MTPTGRSPEARLYATRRAHLHPVAKVRDAITNPHAPHWIGALALWLAIIAAVAGFAVLIWSVKP